MRSHPMRSDPMLSDPMQPGPMLSDPMQPDPMLSDPMRPDSMLSDSMRPDPMLSRDRRKRSPRSSIVVACTIKAWHAFGAQAACAGHGSCLFTRSSRPVRTCGLIVGRT